MKYLTYIKNFFINLFYAIVVWIILIHWWGFRALFMIPSLWWMNLKNKIKRT